MMPILLDDCKMNKMSINYILLIQVFKFLKYTYFVILC